MSDPGTVLNGGNPTAEAASQALVTTTPTTTPPQTLSGAPPAANLTFRKRIKAYAWRATAGWLWLHIITAVALGGDMLGSFESAALQGFLGILSRWGFAPANPVYLPPLLKWGWLLGITSFAPAQLFGFCLYVLALPITMVVRLLAGRTLTDYGSSAPASQRRGLRPPGNSLAIIPLTIFAQLAWFMLYGGAVSKRPLLLGVFFSALLFASLAWRAFQRATPADEMAIGPLTRTAQTGLQWLQAIYDAFKKQPPITKAAAVLSIKLNALPARYWRLFLFAVRGRKGRNRIATLVLLNYVISLLILAASAITFWALVIKTVSVPNPLPFLAALRISSSHFLPGMTADGSIPVPWWCDFGPAVSAWVLFVLYVGPAASLLVRNQEEAMKSSAKLYSVFR
jgi:hypothetical protein